LKNSISIPNGVSEGKVAATVAPRDMTSKAFMNESPHQAGSAAGQIRIEDYDGEAGLNSFGVPLAELQMDGKEGKLKYVEGIKPFHSKRFAAYNKDSDNIWWDGLSGSWQNAVAPTHPDPISGMHCWHQKVILEAAQPGDKIGDLHVNYENNFKTYQAWRDELTRPLNADDKLRRPQHIKRPWVPLSDKAYAVNIKDV